MSLSVENNAEKPPLKDRIIPWYFVGVFMIVFAVNGYFVYMATHTFTGVVTKHAYERGLAHDKTIHNAQEQAALGWSADWALDGNTLRLSLLDRAGNPIQGAQVIAHMMRPTQAGYDFKQTLNEEGNGSYSAAIEFPMKGQWDMTIAVQWKQQSYQNQKRVVVK